LHLQEGHHTSKYTEIIEDKVLGSRFEDNKTFGRFGCNPMAQEGVGHRLPCGLSVIVIHRTLCFAMAAPSSDPVPSIPLSSLKTS
jgi:hypothetical protein